LPELPSGRPRSIVTQQKGYPTQADMESSDDIAPHRPSCAHCGAMMQFARRLPRLGANPELVSYQCEECGHVVTRPEDSEP
jgi:DNA-directed RNA polymerase subunit M/transcription elongation factor TFIIS